MTSWAGAADLSSLLYQQTTQQRVFITTPKGHVVDLAGGATVLDFAYRIHTDLGSRCVGGLVNGVFMPIQAKLQNGQQVEVLSDPKQRPQRQWLEPSLDILFTHRARAKVSEYFRVNNGDELTVPGRRLLLQQKRQLAIPGDDEAFVEACVAASPYNQSDRLLQAVASGEVSYIDLVCRYLASQNGHGRYYPKGVFLALKANPLLPLPSSRSAQTIANACSVTSLNCWLPSICH